MTQQTRTGSQPSGAADVLWSRRPGPTRGPKANLSVDAIAAVAVAIADAEGVEAVSMQRVAEQLGYTKMALYRHLPNKDVLVAVMIDRAVGQPPDLPADASWRSKLVSYAEQLWAVWQAHPWLPNVTIGSRLMGPNETGWVERAIGALAGTGLSGDQQIDAVLLLSAHVRMAHSLSTSGSFPWDADRHLSGPMTEILSEHAGEYPSILAAVADAAGKSVHLVTDGIGLECVLLGIEQLIHDAHP